MSGISIEQQFGLFLYLCVFGLVAGLIFDFFKAWGKVFNFSHRTIFFMDLNICLLLSIALFNLLLHTNRGEVRLYTFTALLIGIILYAGLVRPSFYRGFLVFFQAVQSLVVRIVKRIHTWQELANKKRIKTRNLYMRYKSFFRRKDKS